MRLQLAVEQDAAASAFAREAQASQTAFAIEEVSARLSDSGYRASKQMQSSLHFFQERIEQRVQLGTSQAMSFADRSVAALGTALKSVTNVLASAKKEATARDVAFERAGDVAAKATKESERGLSDLQVSVAGVSDAFDTRQNDLEDQLASIASRLEHTLVAQAGVASKTVEHDMQIAVATAEIKSVGSDSEALGSKLADHDSQIMTAKASIEAFILSCEAQLRSIERRLEFVRSETMYELQASLIRLGSSNPSKSKDVVVNIINPEKLRCLRTKSLRINVGCGHIQFDDYLNIDARVLPGVDVVAAANNLPFGENEVAEIYTSHLVEHFTAEMLGRVLLPHWKSLLKPGGILTTVAPDGAAMLEAVNRSKMTFDDFRDVLFGAQDYDGDYHYNLITPDSYCRALADAGFVKIEVEYTGKKNGKCLELKINARKQ